MIPGHRQIRKRGFQTSKKEFERLEYSFQSRSFSRDRSKHIFGCLGWFSMHSKAIYQTACQIAVYILRTKVHGQSSQEWTGESMRRLADFLTIYTESIHGRQFEKERRGLEKAANNSSSPFGARLFKWKRNQWPSFCTDGWKEFRVC